MTRRKKRKHERKSCCVCEKRTCFLYFPFAGPGLHGVCPAFGGIFVVHRLAHHSASVLPYGRGRRFFPQRPAGRALPGNCGAGRFPAGARRPADAAHLLFFHGSHQRRCPAGLCPPYAGGSEGKCERGKAGGCAGAANCGGQPGQHGYPGGQSAEPVPVFPVFHGL